MQQPGAPVKPSLIDEAQLSYILTDGAMGTELLRRGLPIGGSTAVWNAEQPETVLEVHRAYIDAGCDCLLTNSFSANRLRLHDHGLEARAAELNTRSVELAKQAAGNKWVIGSVGPCSGFSTPREEVIAEQVRDAFAEQIQALANAGVDALILETMTDSAELRLAVEAARAAAAQLPLIVSFCFQKLPSSGTYHLIRSGESLNEAVKLLEELKPDAVGANCGAEMHMEDYATIAAAMRASLDSPIILRPNGGQAAACGEAVQCAVPPERMADELWGLIRAGANIVGGCCGTTPEHVRLFRQELDKL